MSDLGPYAQPLFDSLRDAVPHWVKECLVRFNVDPGDEGECAWRLIEGDLHAALDLAAETAGPNPLAVLRRAATIPSQRLAAVGVAAVGRDEFNVRRSPHDVYDLEPAAWRDFGDDIQELGIIWGAAKTHTHLRRRLRHDSGTTPEAAS